MEILITAGGTIEAIDHVRAITNHSSGALGVKLYEALCARSLALNLPIKVHYVHGEKALLPTNLTSETYFYPIKGTRDVKDTIQAILTHHKPDLILHLMAIADYEVAYAESTDLFAQKLLTWFASNNNPNKEALSLYLGSLNNQEDRPEKFTSKEGLSISLTPSPKIASLIHQLAPQANLVTFKLLSGVTEEELIAVATKQAQRYDSVYVVANDLADITPHAHRALIIKNGQVLHRPTTKQEIADTLIKELLP